MTARRRSALYLPASNARALEKARTLACDVVILDLEDAVAPAAKGRARAAVVEAVRDGGFAERELIVRVNAPDTGEFAADVDALADVDVAALLPKVSSRQTLLAGAAAMPGRPLWAMIETPRAVLDVDAIASAAREVPLVGLVIGTNDLAKEVGCRLHPSRQPIHAALTMSILAARAAGIAILDGVYNDIADADGFERECIEGAAFGFDGKTLIHPKQIETCNRVFSPSADEVGWATGVVAAFDDPANAEVNALSLDGRMVERLHLDVARRILART